MPSNKFAQSTAFGKALDEKITISAKTGILVDNSMVQEFRKNGKVTLFDEETTGFGNFTKENGYSDGFIYVGTSDYQLNQDRSIKFKINEQSVRHTGLDHYISGLSGRFCKRHAGPEVDAYTLSKGFAIANERNHVLCQDISYEDNALKILRYLIDACQDVVGDDTELIAFLSTPFQTALMDSPNITKFIDVATFKQGAVNSQIKKFNDVQLIKTPQGRMKSQFIFNSGTYAYNVEDSIETIQSNFGFKASETAEDIGALVLPKKDALLVIKEIEKTKFFSPDSDEDGDNYRILLHIFYDAICKKSMKDTIFAYKY